MDKATYVNFERTLCYYDIEVLEESLILLNDKLAEDLERATKAKKSCEKTLQRVQEKLQELGGIDDE